MRFNLPRAGIALLLHFADFVVQRLHAVSLLVPFAFTGHFATVP